jgi:hypothetical protein
VFAVRAFKHAIFGTPQPPPTIAPRRLSREESNSLPPAPTLATSKESSNSVKNVDSSNLGLSPTKRGILVTPGTVRGRKKEVAFGSQVVDNEGKKKSRSGIPNSCPGKFPSPWTPKTEDVTDAKSKEEEKSLKAEEKKPKTRLTETLYEAKPTGTSPRKVKVRAKDDADITIDIMEPRSESGRYWKEQYQSYSRKSEEETKKLIAKQKLARDYARKKDDEANELRRQLESDRKKRHTRVQSLEQQVKDMREQLRQALAENTGLVTELAVLRQQREAASISRTTKPASVDDQALITNTISFLTQRDTVQEPHEPEALDSIWSDVVGPDEEDNSRVLAPFLQASMVPTRSRGEPARTRHQRERRVHHKSSTITSQDSVVATDEFPRKSETKTLKRTPTPRPGSLNSTPTRRTLGERDINSFVSPPAPTLPSPSDLENITPSSARRLKKSGAVVKTRRELFDFDSSAPLEALSMQAGQLITPQQPAKEGNPEERTSTTPVQSSRKHKRSEAKVNLPNDRVAAAKARLAEKRRGKENSRIS